MFKKNYLPRNTIVGVGEGALAGLAFGNPALGIAVGAGVGASGLGAKLKLPFFKKGNEFSLFQGGSKTRRQSRELANIGRGNVFNEAKRARLYSRRSKSRSRHSSSRRSSRQSRLQHPLRISRSRSRSRSRSPLRSRSNSMQRALRGPAVRVASKLLRSRSPSPFRQTAEDRDEQMKRTLAEMQNQENKNNYYRLNPHLVSPGQPYPN